MHNGLHINQPSNGKGSRTKHNDLLLRVFQLARGRRPAAASAAVLQLSRTTEPARKRKERRELKKPPEASSLNQGSLLPEPFDESAADADSFPPRLPESPGPSSSPLPGNHTFPVPTSTRTTFSAATTTTANPAGESLFLSQSLFLLLSGPLPVPLTSAIAHLSAHHPSCLSLSLPDPFRLSARLSPFWHARVREHMEAVRLTRTGGPVLTRLRLLGFEPTCSEVDWRDSYLADSIAPKCQKKSAFDVNLKALLSSPFWLPHLGKKKKNFA